MASIIARLLGDSTDFNKKVSGAKGQIKAFKSAMGTIGVGIGAGAVVAWMNDLIRSGSHLTDVAEKLGVTTDYLQEMTYMATQNGVAVNAVEMGLQRFTRRLGEAAQGGGELLPVLQQYNVQIKDTEGNTRSAEAVINDLADIIKATPSEAERLRIAFKAFDSEGAVMVNLLQKGSAEMKSMGREAHELGVVVGGDALQQMDKYSDSIDRFLARLRTAGTQGLGAAVTGIEDFSRWWFDIFEQTADEINEESFKKAAEAQIRFSKEVVKVQSGWGTTEYIKENGKLISLADAVSELAREIEEKEKASAAAMREQVAAAQARTEETQKASVAAQALAGANERVAAAIAEGADALKFKMLPDAEKLRAIEAMIAAEMAKANDSSLAEKDRLAAAKQVNKLKEEEAALVDKIAETQRKSDEEAVKAAEKRRDLLDKQADAQKAYTKALADYQSFDQQRLTPTFESVASGQYGSSSQQSLAIQIQEMRDRIADDIARGFTQENIDRGISNLKALENRFDETSGVSATPDNPFKTALEKTEDELEKSNKLLAAL